MATLKFLLRSLQEKGVEFSWTKSCEESLMKVKNAISNDKMLIQKNESYHLH